MRLGLHTDSLRRLPLDAALELAASVGVRAVEIPCGGQSTAPHLSLQALLSSELERARLRSALDRHGLQLSALNCSAWPLHPTRHDEHSRLIRDTVRLANLLGAETIVTMSGCPGDGSATVNWIWYPWPQDAVDLLQRHWHRAVDFWATVGAHAREHGVTRIAMELHPVHLVHNVPTLTRLREAVGDCIGANLDPSHFFWQQVDPLRAVEALGAAVYHVHLKDLVIRPDEMALAGVLDDRPFGSSDRAWSFATVGMGHGRGFWRQFVDALASVGYDGALSIENADPSITAHPHVSQEDALRAAATLASAILAKRSGSALP